MTQLKLVFWVGREGSDAILEIVVRTQNCLQKLLCISHANELDLLILKEFCALSCPHLLRKCCCGVGGNK